VITGIFLFLFWSLCNDGFGFNDGRRDGSRFDNDGAPRRIFWLGKSGERGVAIGVPVQMPELYFLGGVRGRVPGLGKNGAEHGMPDRIGSAAGTTARRHFGFVVHRRSRYGVGGRGMITPNDDLPRWVMPVDLVTVDDMVRTGSCREGVDKFVRRIIGQPSAMTPADWSNWFEDQIRHGLIVGFEVGLLRYRFAIAANAARNTEGDYGRDFWPCRSGCPYTDLMGFGHGRQVGQSQTSGAGHGYGESAYGEAWNVNSGASRMLDGAGEKGLGYGSQGYGDKP